MPAAPEEVEEAARRGRSRSATASARSASSAGTDRVVGVEFLKVSRVFDESGRFAPEFVEGSEYVVPAESVIVSIGQTGDFSFLAPEDGVETKGGRIIIDPDTLATTAPDVFTGGDAAFGPRIAINAVADGRKAARSIDTFLRGAPRPELSTEVEIEIHPRWDRPYDTEGIPRQKPPVRPIERRIGIAEVEECFGNRSRASRDPAVSVAGRTRSSRRAPPRGRNASSAAGARTSARRTASRSSPAEFVVELPEGARELAPILVDGRAEGSILMKDEEICIRCGLCALRCPAGTITMQSFDVKEVARA